MHIACWDMERVVAWDGSEIAVRDVNCALQELAVRSGWLCCAAACRGNRRLQYGTTTCLKHGHDQERQHQKRRQHRVRFLANRGSCRARRHAHLLARSGARMQTNQFHLHGTLENFSQTRSNSILLSYYIS